MQKISLRQNKHGAWWANLTHKGYDISVEGLSINEAKDKISSELNVPLSKLEFENQIPYTDNKAVTTIGYRDFWIDRECRRK